MISSFFPPPTAGPAIFHIPTLDKLFSIRSELCRDRSDYTESVPNICTSTYICTLLYIFEFISIHNTAELFSFRIGRNRSEYTEIAQNTTVRIYLYSTYIPGTYVYIYTFTRIIYVFVFRFEYTEVAPNIHVYPLLPAVPLSFRTSRNNSERPETIPNVHRR